MFFIQSLCQFLLPRCRQVKTAQEVLLERVDGRPFGISVGAHPAMEGLVVLDVESFYALRPQTSRILPLAVSPGDMILDVNGITTADRMLEELDRAERVLMLVSDEPTEFQLQIFSTLKRKHQRSKAVDGILQTVQKCSTGDTCSICHENYETMEVAKVQLPCGHCFHKPCVKRWLSGTLRCPLCNANLRLFGGWSTAVQLFSSGVVHRSLLLLPRSLFQSFVKHDRAGRKSIWTGTCSIRVLFRRLFQVLINIHYWS